MGSTLFFFHEIFNGVLFGPSCYLLSFLFLVSRNGEIINLCSYAHCADADCICKSSSENFSSTTGMIKSSVVTLQLHKGFYHDCYGDIVKVSFSLCTLHACFAFLNLKLLILGMF